MKTSRLIARGLKKKIEAFEKAVAKHNKRRPSKENDAKILRLVKEMTETFELAVKTKRVFPAGIKRFRPNSREARAERRIGPPYCL